MVNGYTSDEAILLFSLSVPACSKGSPLPGKSLFLYERILSLKSGAYSKSCILQRRTYEFMLIPFVKLMKNTEVGKSVKIFLQKEAGSIY